MDHGCDGVLIRLPHYLYSLDEAAVIVPGWVTLLINICSLEAHFDGVLKSRRQRALWLLA